MARTEQTKKTGKRKKWYTITAPDMLHNKVLGEIYLREPSDMKGRNIKLNLFNITGDIKKQNVNINFRIKDYADGKGITEFIGYEMSSSTVRRWVRHDISRVDDSFVLKTKDDVFVRVKPLVITFTKAHKPVKTRIRMISRSLLKSIINKNSLNDIFEQLISFKIQKNLKSKVATVHPVKTALIRMLVVTNEKKETPIEEIKEFGKKKETKEKKTSDKKEKETKEAEEEKELKKEKETKKEKTEKNKKD
ncbi:hypothetical protein JW949_02870 [Candidatus Woesearchaeota archaeon]|nr:hypothetical protein [Candidatus Woesearchaeota archaeon]